MRPPVATRLTPHPLRRLAALAIVGGVFVAVCIEALVAPKDPS
jgi:hypothetical protein